MPDWVRHAVWWQVYPLGFVGAPIRPEGDAGDRPVEHRLERIADWLDYAVELGASGLALGPVFAAATHGYDTLDHYRIDPRLGDEQDFADLVKAAHGRGLRVLLDGVFNHVGRGFPAFQRVLREGPGAERASWFRLRWPDGTAPGVEPDYDSFEGHPELVALNHDEPAVADYVTGVMTHWLRAGADGWRLDAAYAVPPTFWASVLPRVRAEHPQAYLVGEVIHGDYAGIVRSAGMDSLTQYELWKAIWSSINDRNLFELAWALDRHDRYLDSFVPLTFVGNHDVTRIASRLTEEAHLPHALALLLTVGGTPSLYSGDEQAFRGTKEDRAGGDDAVRPPFPAGPAELADAGRSTYRLHQDLIGLRRRHPWLHRARTTLPVLANAHAVLESRADPADPDNPDGRVWLALNLDDAGRELSVDGASNLLLGPGSLHEAGTPNARVSLPPHGWAVLD